jgi:hypothetical protein
VELHQASELWQRDSVLIVHVLKLSISSILDPTIPSSEDVKAVEHVTNARRFSNTIIDIQKLCETVISS